MDVLEKYITEHTTIQDELLTELERATNLSVVQPRMLSGAVQGKLLEFFTRMISPHRVLEIGTFTGYSAICFAKGLPENGEVHTIEIDDELEAIASKFFTKGGFNNRIFQYIGNALNIMDNFTEPFDLIFIDGDKREYPQYYKKLWDKGLLHSGSWIIADNVWWYGKVVEPLVKGDLFTKGIVEFNDMVQTDQRVENTILPLRDGMFIIRVK